MFFGKKRKKKQTAPEIIKPETRKVILSDVPDYPQAFGYKIDWMAVKDVEPDFVVKKLGMHKVQPANWETGLEKAYEGKDRMCFISPPVNGWCLIISKFYLSMDTKEHIDRTLEILRILSADNHMAHSYGSYRVVDYCAWAKAENGEVTRAFSYLEGNIMLNIGPQTIEEAELGFTDYAGQATEKWLQMLENDDDNWHIDEEDVTNLARLWSIDPILLDGMSDKEKSDDLVLPRRHENLPIKTYQREKGVGLVARLPTKLY